MLIFFNIIWYTVIYGDDKIRNELFINTILLFISSVIYIFTTNSQPRANIIFQMCMYTNYSDVYHSVFLFL